MRHTLGANEVLLRFVCEAPYSLLFYLPDDGDFARIVFILLISLQRMPLEDGEIK